MSRLRIGIIGSTGRMGRIVQDLVVNDATLRESFMLVYAVSGPKDPAFATLKRERPQVLIDFSAPQSSLAAAKLCAEAKVPMLVCTTGFSKEEFAKLNTLLKKTPWVFAPNTSMGISALGQALMAVFRLLPKDYDVSMVEIHHSAKKDAPSGTAKYLEKIILESTGKSEMPVLSIRGGTEAGEHKIIILGPAERLEFTHRAGNRSLFAHGALKISLALAKLKARAKPYTIEEVLA